MIRSTSIALCLVLCQAIPLNTNEDGTIQAMDQGVASIGNKSRSGFKRAKLADTTGGGGGGGSDEDFQLPRTPAPTLSKTGEKGSLPHHDGNYTETLPNHVTVTHLHHPDGQPKPNEGGGTNLFSKQEPIDLVDIGKGLAGKEQADKCRAQQAEMAKTSNKENTKLFETKSSELKAGGIMTLADYMKGSQKMQYSDEVMKAMASNMTKNMRLEASPPDYENGPESKRESVAKTFAMNGIVEMMTDEEIAEVKERHAMWHPGRDQSSIALVLADNYLYDGHNTKAMQLLSAGIRKTKKPNVKKGKLKQRIKKEDKEFARDVLSATKDAGYEMVKQAVTDWKDSLMPEFSSMPTLYDFQAKIDSLNCPSQWCSATCGAYDSLNTYIDGDVLTTWERVDEDLQSLADTVAGAIDICDAVDTVYTLAYTAKPAAYTLSQVPEPTVVKPLFTSLYTVIENFVRIVSPFNTLLGNFKTKFLQPIATGIEKAQAGSEKAAEMLELVRQTFKSYLYDPVKVADNICQHATKEVCTASVTNAIHTAEQKLRDANGAATDILNTLTTVVAALNPFEILLGIDGMENFLEEMMKIKAKIDPIFAFMDFKFCVSFPTTVTVGTTEHCPNGKANLLAAGDGTAAHTNDVTLSLASGPSITSTQQEERARRIAVAKRANSGLITGNKFDRLPANITDRALLAALDKDPTLDMACLGMDLGQPDYDIPPKRQLSEATKTKLFHFHHPHNPHYHVPHIHHPHNPHYHFPKICFTLPDPTKLDWGGHIHMCTMTVREVMGHFTGALFRAWAIMIWPALALVPVVPVDFQWQIISGIRDLVTDFIMDKLFNNVINDWISKLTGFDVNRFLNLIVNVPALPSMFNGISLPNVNLGNWLPGFNIPSNIYNPIGYPSWAGFSAPMNWVSDLTIRLPGVNFKPNLPSINTGCWAQCTTYTLTMSSSAWGSEISWTIDDKINNERSYSNHGTFTQSVCLTSGTHKLECKDSYGDGWHGGHITINGKANNLCADFGSGKSKSVWFTV